MSGRTALREGLLGYLAGTGRVPATIEAGTPLISSGLIDSATLFGLALWIEEAIGRPVDITGIDLPADWDTVELILAFVDRQLGLQRVP